MKHCVVKNGQVLQRAVWPRVLTFSAPENLVVEGEDDPLLVELVVTEPEIVRSLRPTQTYKTDAASERLAILGRKSKNALCWQST